METIINGISFKKVDDDTIAVHLENGKFHKRINYPAKTEQDLIESANFYYVHCY